MNLTIERGPALAALRRLSEVVARKSTIPILANVALSADGEALNMRATNLDMEASETFAAFVTDAGATSVPADKLRDIVHNAEPGSQIALSQADLRMVVKSGRSRFNMPALGAEDFPSFKADDFIHSFKMPAKTLADMLSRVAWAVDPNKDIFLGSVYLVTTDDELHAVGAANKGIALRREPKPEGAYVKALLPPQLVPLLVRWLGEGEDDVTVSTTDSAYKDEGPARLIQFERGGSVLRSKLFDAPKFVPYLDLFPKGPECVAVTDQDALKAALKRVLVMSEDRGKPIKLCFSDGGLAIQARGADAAEGEDEISADYEGPDHDYTLTASRLSDALDHLRGDRVEIGFRSESTEDINTAKVSIRAPADPAFSCFLMQLRG